MANDQPRGTTKTWDTARRRAGLVVPAGLADRFWPATCQLLAQWAVAEVAPGRLVPWLAVASASASSAISTADREPAWWAASIAAVIAVAIAYAARQRPVGFPLALGVAAMAVGFASRPCRPCASHIRFCNSPASSVTLSGFVEIREERERSDRVVVHVHKLSGARMAEAPERVRVAVRKGTAPAVGSFVELKAHLSPRFLLKARRLGLRRDMYFRYRRGRLCARAKITVSLSHRCAFNSTKLPTAAPCFAHRDAHALRRFGHARAAEFCGRARRRGRCARAPRGSQRSRTASRSTQ